MRGMIYLNCLQALKLTEVRWHSTAMGRSSMLKVDDIKCRLPSNQPVLTNLCAISEILEANSEGMYSRKTESLRLLYDVAHRTYGQLRSFAESAGIGAGKNESQNKVAALHLHQCTLRHSTSTYSCILIMAQYTTMLSS